MIPRLARAKLALILLAAAGCGRAESGDTTGSPGARSTPIGSIAEPPAMTMVEIVSGPRKWTAQIDDSPAARDFLAQLPVTLSLKDYGGNEKIADLPRPLTREGAPDAMTPRAGDVAFYAPWGNLAIFYRDGHHSPGLIRLGQLQGDPAHFGGAGSLSVTIRRPASGLSIALSPTNPTFMPLIGRPKTRRSFSLNHSTSGKPGACVDAPGFAR